MSTAQQSTFYIDTHCHLYDRLSSAEFFRAYIRNLSSTVGARFSQDKDTIGVCLVDLKGNNSFAKLASGEAQTSRGLGIQQIDACTLEVSIDAQSVRVFKGQQVNTQEGLELIAMGYAGTLPENQPLGQYFELCQSEASVVLPWGVGKWLGKRGRLVDQLLSKKGGAVLGDFILGDNGGRPWWWRESRFSAAQSQSALVLAGSDALPVASYQDRVGGYLNGFSGRFERCQDWLDHLKSLNTRPAQFGKLNSTMGFFREQLGIRMQ